MNRIHRTCPVHLETMIFRSQIQSVDDLRSPAGKLEAILNTGLADAPYSAIVCHPHPPSGGTMHTKTVYHAMKAFSHFGLPVLRFNFRGTGLSEGAYDDGPGEIDDVRAALDWLTAQFPTPILFAGFSFGSNIGLRACCGDPRVRALVGLGLPVRASHRDYKYDFLTKCAQPKLFISGDHDEFSPKGVVEHAIANAPGEKQVVWIENADHFFAGIEGSPEPKLLKMQMAMREWLAATLPDLTVPNAQL